MSVAPVRTVSHLGSYLISSTTVIQYDDRREPAPDLSRLTLSLSNGRTARRRRSPAPDCSVRGFLGRGEHLFGLAWGEQLFGYGY